MLPTAPDPLRLSIWAAPLVPVALGFTAGIVFDHFHPLPLLVSFIAVVGALLAWSVTFFGNKRRLSLLYLGLAIVASGACYHHARRHVLAVDDISRLASDNWRPIRLRGVLVDQPLRRSPPGPEALRSIPWPVVTQATLRVDQVGTSAGWEPACGHVLLRAEGELTDLHAGDTLELTGRIAVPQPPENPGEFHYADWLADRGIRASVLVRKASVAVVRLKSAETWSLPAILVAARTWGQQTLATYLPSDLAGLARALLLGDGSGLAQQEWDKYVRTGVVHVLVVSGQHLAILGMFLGFCCRLAFFRGRTTALIVAAALAGYALLTGMEPPVLRAAVLVAVLCGALCWRRPVFPANAFALAWLVISLVDPTDLFRAGCQLSFLATAIFWWGRLLLPERQQDPLVLLVVASLPAWQRLLRTVGTSICALYAWNAAVWIAVTPLVAFHCNLIPLTALLLGPIVTCLASVALVSGLLLLLAAPFCPPMAWVGAWFCQISLRGCDALVTFADQVQPRHWYVSDLSPWWLSVFYLLLLAVLTHEWLRQRVRWVVVAGLTWLAVGLFSGLVKSAAEELRCTFLAVGHGGCIVLETPDRRTLLYDAGSMSGPDVTRQKIAPFLWHHGIRRIDELFLSHADLDHFNGLPALLERFPIGQISCTPTFAHRKLEGVRLTLAALEGRKVPVRVIHAGDRLFAGEVIFDVLHPPAAGPDGPENVRSLVLLVRHAGNSILLTGDLEGVGRDLLLSQSPGIVDVLQAPHHGSPLANGPELVAWARPRLVVACQRRLHEENPVVPHGYRASGAHYLSTGQHGAITIRSRSDGVIVETYRTKERFILSQPRP